MLTNANGFHGNQNLTSLVKFNDKNTRAILSNFFIVDYEKCYLSTPNFSIPNLLFLNTAPRNLFNVDNNGSQFVIASLPTLKQTACNFIKKETPRKPATLLKR